MSYIIIWSTNNSHWKELFPRDLQYISKDLQTSIVLYPQTFQSVLRGIYPRLVRISSEGLFPTSHLFCRPVNLPTAPTTLYIGLGKEKSILFPIGNECLKQSGGGWLQNCKIESRAVPKYINRIKSTHLTWPLSGHGHAGSNGHIRQASEQRHTKEGGAEARFFPSN